MKRLPHRRQRIRGVSLIELMIAMVIGLIVMLAVIQVFAASRSAYQLSAGLARVQENSRFAMDSLQRELRMAGHFGCVNDQAHAQQATNSLYSTLITTHPALDFTRSVQGYEATGTAPGDTLTLGATPATGGTGYSPALPSQYAAAMPNRVNGSDIVALRYLMPDGVPVTSTGGTPDKPVFNFDPARLSVLQSGVTNPGLFGVSDCLSATVFQASAVSNSAGSVTFNTATNNATNFTALYTEGQANLYRAESIVFYVGYDAATRQSQLYRVRFTASPGGALTAQPPEALVEGVENMQLLYGQDRQLDSTSPTGYIDRQGTATAVQASLTDKAQAWRRVGAVQLGLLVSSPDPAAAKRPSGDAELISLGVTFTVPNDTRMRSVYQTTIAMRNRLYGN